jgi:integrase
MTKRKAKGIRKFRNRWQFDVVDSKGVRLRGSRDTKAEAIAAKQRIEAEKASTGFGFFASSTKKTFSELLDELIPFKRDIGGVSKDALDGIQSTINANLKKAPFANWTLAEFLGAASWKVVQDWLVGQFTEHGKAYGTLQGYRSVISTAFDLAVQRQYLPYNPVQRFKLHLPKAAAAGKDEGKVLLLEDVAAALRGVLARKQEDRQELTWLARCMIFLIGFFTGMRNEELAGLCWDCVNIADREIYVSRIHRNGQLLNTTKTGKKGRRTIPMSPILVAAFETYRERLAARGKAVEGAIPVLVARYGSGFVTREAISVTHWAVIAKKAGFIDANGSHRYTYYDLRHTAATLWTKVEMKSTDVQSLMGHSDYKTTVENYLHRAPQLFADIRTEVVQSVGIDRTPENIIDALGFALARRWKNEGIDIGCAPPRAKPERLAFDEQLALPSADVLDLTPSAAIENAVQPGLLIKSHEDLRLWQMSRAKELYAQGWPVTRIAAELGVNHSTVKYWLDHADIKHTRGKLKPELREELKAKVLAYFAEHPDTPNIDMAKLFGVHTKRLKEWLQGRGTPGRHRQRDYKLAQHKEQIERWVAEGKTYREMARLLNDEVGHSAIAHFVRKNLKVKTKRWGGGLRVDQFDADIRRMAAEGKDSSQIAEELHAVSRSSITRYIKKLGLQTPEFIAGNAARSRARKQLEKQELTRGLGTKLPQR